MIKGADENGLKCSPWKTVCFPILLHRVLFPSLSLDLNELDVLVRDEHNFVGVIFDNNLTFAPHFNKLKHMCLRTADILQILSYKLGVRIKNHLAPLQCTWKNQAGLWCSCVWVPTTIWFENVRPCPSPGSPSGYLCFPHIPRCQPLCAVGTDISCKSKAWPELY